MTDTIDISNPSGSIFVPNEIVQMIEFRRASFEYAVIANLIEDNDFSKETLINYLREQSKRFTIAHDDSQKRYKERMENESKSRDTSDI